MTNARIYNLAYMELLRMRESEQSRFQDGRNNTITTARLEKLDKEIREIHHLILEAEHEEENR